jgi:hypothetical protein
MTTETENKNLQMMTMTGNDAMMQTLLNVPVFEQMQRAATLFSKSGLVPKNFENNPAACFVGLQLAAQLGVNPFMLFQKIYNIGGKIGIEAQVAIAIANQRGVFEGPIEHKFSGQGDTRSCTATAILAKSKKPVSLEIDWKTVNAEGWNKKGGSKWLTMPDQMFRYRSSLWLIRTYAPECLMGLNSIDEIEDMQMIDVTPTRKTPDAINEAVDAAFAEKQTEQKTEIKEEATDPRVTMLEEIEMLKAKAGLRPDFAEKTIKTLLGETSEKPTAEILAELPESRLNDVIKGLQGIVDAKAKR